MPDRSEQIKAQVKGFLNPIFVERDPKTGEVLLNGLGVEDFEAVRQGFACARCLAIFDQYTITCPACLYQRDWTADLPRTPALWLDHLREREQEDPTPRQPRSIERAIAAKMKDSDIEVIRLGRSKKGARRS